MNLDFIVTVIFRQCSHIGYFNNKYMYDDVFSTTIKVHDNSALLVFYTVSVYYCFNDFMINV